MDIERLIQPIIPVSDIIEEVRADAADLARRLGDDMDAAPDDPLRGRAPLDSSAAAIAFDRVRRAMLPYERRNYCTGRLRARVFPALVRACRPGAGFWFARELANINKELGVRGFSLHSRKLLFWRTARLKWPELGPSFVGDPRFVQRRGIDPEPTTADMLHRKKARLLGKYGFYSIKFRLVVMPYNASVAEYHAMTKMWFHVLGDEKRLCAMEECQSRRHTQSGTCPACGAITVAVPGSAGIQHITTSVFSIDVEKEHQRNWDDCAYEEAVPLREARKRLTRICDHVGIMHEDKLAALVAVEGSVKHHAVALLQAIWRLRACRREIAAEREFLIASERRVATHCKERSAIVGSKEIEEQFAAVVVLQAYYRAYKARVACATMNRIRAARRIEEAKLSLILRSIRGDRKLMHVVQLRAERRAAAKKAASEQEAKVVMLEERELQQSIKRPQKRRESVVVPTSLGRKAMVRLQADLPTIFRYAPMIRERRIHLVQQAARTYGTRYWVVGSKKRTEAMRLRLKQEAELDQWVVHYVCQHTIGSNSKHGGGIERVCGATRFYCLEDIRKHEAMHAEEDRQKREEAKRRREEERNRGSGEKQFLAMIKRKREKLLAAADAATAKARANPHSAAAREAAEMAEANINRKGVAQSETTRDRMLRRAQQAQTEMLAIKRHAGQTRLQMAQRGLRRMRDKSEEEQQQAAAKVVHEAACAERRLKSSAHEKEFLREWRLQQEARAKQEQQQALQGRRQPSWARRKIRQDARIVHEVVARTSNDLLENTVPQLPMSTLLTLPPVNAQGSMITNQ